MTEKEQRIKLAEAMGWWLFKDKYWQPPSVTKDFAEGCWDGPVPIAWDATPLPDPFTNANDDYAVLEWMRIDGKYVDDIQGYKVNYRIGDYARAALKVLI